MNDLSDDKVDNLIKKTEEEKAKKREKKERKLKGKLDNLKHIEYVGQAYASFYNTKMEKDKSILTLSVAGIGFLITLLGFHKGLGIIHMVFFLLSALSFLVSIYFVINIFEKNSDYIIDLTRSVDVRVKECKLQMLDDIVIKSFYFAIVMALCFGVAVSGKLF
jgi:hypothetical protein